MGYFKFVYTCGQVGDSPCTCIYSRTYCCIMNINKCISSARILTNIGNPHQSRIRTVRITNLNQGWGHRGLGGLYSKDIRLRRITAILLGIELVGGAYC